jgi:amino acid permease
MSATVEKEPVPNQENVHAYGIEVDDNSNRNGSYFGAYFNIVCLIAGAGVLSLPKTLAEGGWISVCFLFLSAAMSTYSGKMLIECHYYKPGYRLVNFPDVGEAAFGKAGKIIVRIFYFTLMLGVGCIFVILMGIFLDNLLNKVTPSMNQKLWSLVGGAAMLIPFVSLKTMKEIAILSAFGVFATFLVIIVASVLGLIDLSNQAVAAVHDIVIWKGLPSSLATISFSFGGNVIYSHVERVMKQPKRFNSVLTMAMGSVCGAYLIIAVIGYYVYGNEVQSPILESLPKTWPNLMCMGVMAFHLFAAAPIILCSLSLEIESILKISPQYMSKSKEIISRSVLRLGIGAIVLIVAYFIPYFAQVMDLVSALTNCMTVYFLPVVCHLKLFGWRQRSFLSLFWIFIIIACGVIGCVMGTWNGVESLIAAFEKDA